MYCHERSSLAGTKNPVLKHCLRDDKSAKFPVSCDRLAFIELVVSFSALHVSF